MSRVDGTGGNWRYGVAIDEDQEDGPSIILNATGESAAEALRRTLAAGRWDAAAEPDIQALLALAADLMEAPGVVAWVEEEIMMEAESGEAKAVRRCFQAYLEAILDEDGPTAACLLADSTLQQYDRYRSLALGDESVEGETDTPLIDLLCVGIFRLFLTPEQLESMTPQEIVEFGVEYLFAGKRGAEDISIGAIEVDGDRASAETFAEDQQLPCNLAFCKEEGEWRVEITSLMPVIEMTYAALAEESKMTPDAFIAAILEEIAADEEDE